jgi:hypothetical protein
MDREQYEGAKKRLEEVTRRLKYESISPQEREALEKEGRGLLAVVMSPWIPVSFGYRILMLVVVGIGFWGLIEGQYLYLLAWLLLPLFSPRIIGKCLSASAGLGSQ